MLYIYDNAIASDLASSIDPDASVNDIVKIIGKEGILPLIAQMKEDMIKFPVLCLIRDPETAIDTTRVNFTAMHKGVPLGIETESQNIYLEKTIPINLSYTLSILATNTVDSDELLRELMFKYTSQYFLNVKLPYEVDRNIRIGVIIDPGSITRNSGSLEYIQSGSLYETQMKLNCQGACMVTYTPKHVVREDVSGIEIV